MTWIARNPTDF